MKSIHIGLAALAMSLGGAAAIAQPNHVVTRTTTVERHSGWHGPRAKRRVCTVRWHDHRKVRRCVWR